MNQPLINILLRTSFRPSAFKRCAASIMNQTYRNISVIVSYDNYAALDYIPHDWTALPLHKNDLPFGYNLYCNELKELVNDGWFFFLDDDDVLADPMCVEKLIPYLSDMNVGIICQFLRNGIPKPVRQEIVKGRIGMPCIVLHHAKKNLCDFVGTEDADYIFIRDISEKMELIFIPHVLVKAGRRGMGQIETIDKT